MRLKRLEATGFRNLTGAAEFAPGLNILHGANAQGKTSWLEAISLLGTTKSFRTAQPREAIGHGQKETLLRGVVARGNLIKELQLQLTPSEKRTFLNGKREPVARYLSNLVTIAFTAEEAARVFRLSP